MQRWNSKATDINQIYSQKQRLLDGLLDLNGPATANDKGAVTLPGMLQDHCYTITYRRLLCYTDRK